MPGHMRLRASFTRVTLRAPAPRRLPPWLTASQTPLRIAFNIGCLYLLMRVWPVSGRAFGGGEADHVHVQVPFSEFVRWGASGARGLVGVCSGTGRVVAQAGL